VAGKPALLFRHTDGYDEKSPDGLRLEPEVRGQGQASSALQKPVVFRVSTDPKPEKPFIDFNRKGTIPFTILTDRYRPMRFR